MDWAGKHMASSKMAKPDTAASDDDEDHDDRRHAATLIDCTERAEQLANAERLAERCAELLRTLPMGRTRRASDADGPWFNYYKEHPGAVRADLEFFIKGYFLWQSHCPELGQRWRKNFDDMHNAAVKFAASIRRFGGRNSLPDPDDDNCPDLEAMLTNLESMITWMGNNPSKHLLPPPRSDLNKCRSRSFVEWVIFVVESYTGKAIKQDTKGLPTTELRVLKEIVAIVDPAIGPGTITEALKHIRKTGFNPRGSRRANELAIGFFPAHGGEIRP